MRFVYFIVAPSGDQLRQIGSLLDAGQVRPIVDQVFALAEARQAYEAGIHGHPRGKIVLTISGVERDAGLQMGTRPRST